MYRAYGLVIDSALPLPELPETEETPDLRVRLHHLKPEGLQSQGTHCRFRVADGEAWMSWDGVGTFAARRGCEILVHPAPGADERLVRLFLLGAVMAALLQQRGCLILHGSAVGVRGSSVGFLGGCGWGKSTLAGALCAGGHTLVSDDVLALSLTQDGWRAAPGYPMMKLWPDAAEALGESVEGLPRIDPLFEKRARSVGEQFEASPLPLMRIYVLAEGDLLDITPLPRRDAFVELVRHSFWARMLPSLGARPHFFQCAEVARTASLRRLSRNRALTDVHEVARAVERDLES
jgi:hypothetical protein